MTVAVAVAPDACPRTGVRRPSELCGVRFPLDALPELPTALHDPRLMGRLIEQAWLTFLRAEAAAAPVLLVLDDLHWSDGLSVQLVNAALRELGAAPGDRAAAAARRGATARLVRQALGDRVGDDNVKRIVARSAGNALYLEELIRAAEAGREAVPETVVAMLQARHEILEHRPGEPDGKRWQFRHALMRDASYGLLAPDDRSALHLLAARHLAAAGGDDAVVAGHFELGGDSEEALGHRSAAGEQAQRRADHAAVADALALIPRDHRWRAQMLAHPHLGRSMVYRRYN